MIWPFKRRKLLIDYSIDPDIKKLIDDFGNTRFMAGYACHISSKIGEQGWVSRGIEAKKNLYEAIEKLTNKS